MRKLFWWSCLCWLLHVPGLQAQHPTTAETAAEQEWRASDHEDRPKPAQMPYAKDQRVGAVCQDSTRSNGRGTGTCSGHGGVAFWIYENDQGVEVAVTPAGAEVMSIAQLKANGWHLQEMAKRPAARASGQTIIVDNGGLTTLLGVALGGLLVLVVVLIYQRRRIS